MPRIALIPYSSSYYEQSKRCRQNVLRTPIGLALSEKDVAGEELQLHIAALDEADKVVGTVLLKPLTPTLIKLRQMAVDHALQGAGLGSRMVRFAEQIAHARGFHRIELNARVYAKGFYEKLGYAAEGDEFEEVGLVTVKMTKSLNEAGSA